jgi:hypothetical protein
LDRPKDDDDYAKPDDSMLTEEDLFDNGDSSTTVEDSERIGDFGIGLWYTSDAE